MIRIPYQTFSGITLLLAATSFLAACGGSSSGGSGSALPAPQGLSAQALNASALLDWSEVDEASSYNIYYSTDPDIDINNPGTGGSNWDWISDVTPPHTLDTLENGVTYYVVATATNGGRESQASDEIAITPQAGISGRVIQTSARTVSADSYMHSLNTTMCADSMIAAGGGFRITSSDNDAALRIHSSFPTRTGAAGSQTYGWTARAFNENSAVQGSLTVESQIVCIDEPDNFESVSNTGLTLDGNSSDVLESECSQGNVAISGGGFLGGVNHVDPGIRLAYSQRDTDDEAIWRTTLHNVSPDGHTNIRADAICASPLRGLSRETSFTIRPEDFVPAGTYGEHLVRCPAGQSVLHGGLYRLGGAENQPTDLVLQQSYADTDSQDRDIWRVRVYNSAAEARPMGAYAMCVDSDD
ncbi:MAG: fibronectin type III domain-containing protein [Alcanivorax sp.]|nr:fibronectin type III domain-containing protein [Alcanivorax sp.]